MNLDLSGKRAFISGASQGIGEASAKELASYGADITLFARTEEKLSKLAIEIEKEYGVKCDYVASDINNLAELKRNVEAKLKENGNYHILINNSGGPKGGPLLDADPVELLQFFQNHILAAQVLVNVFKNGMNSDKYGRIINIISTSVKQPIPNLGASNIIRGAMASWAKTISREMGEFTTVNNILPGFTETPRLHSLAQGASNRLGKTKEEVINMWAEQSPLKRIARPEELGYAIGFLASPSAAFISGINLPVDGGRLATL